MDTSATVDQFAVTEAMWREVIGQLRAFVGRRIADPHRAEDLVGEILLKAHASAHSIDDQERFPHWVLRVARNAVIDEYRRAGRSRERLEATPVEPLAEDPWLADSSEVLTELATCLHPLLDGLAPGAAPRGAADRPGRVATGPRRPARGRLAVGNEVPSPARATPAGRSSRAVLHAELRRPWRTHGVRPATGLWLHARLGQ